MPRPVQYARYGTVQCTAARSCKVVVYIIYQASWLGLQLYRPVGWAVGFAQNECALCRRRLVGALYYTRYMAGQ